MKYVVGTVAEYRRNYMRELSIVALPIVEVFHIISLCSDVIGRAFSLSRAKSFGYHLRRNEIDFDATVNDNLSLEQRNILGRTVEFFVALAPLLCHDADLIFIFDRSQQIFQMLLDLFL